MRTVGPLSSSLVGIAAGTLAATIVAITLGEAYREGEIVNVLIPLALPPTVLFFVYAGSDKQAIFSLASAALAGALLGLTPSLGVDRAGVPLLSITIAALATPLAIDLLFVDRGKRIRFDHTLARASALAFLTALVPTLVWTLTQAHAMVLREDTHLVNVVAARISPRGNSLVVEPLDPNLRERVQRRITIRSGGRSYDLSDADVESVVWEEQTFRKKTGAHGAETREFLSKEQAERMRLILHLQGTPIPSEVVIGTRRGPLTIYEAKVPLAKRGS